MNVDTAPRAPLRSNVFTRAIYVVSLAGLVLGFLSTASSWVGLALGGGPIASTGGWVFVFLLVAVVYRVYTVIRYRTALDARPPNLLGRLLRALGWVLMAAGAAGTLSLFFVKPIALLIFKTPGDAGIAYFVTGLYATVMAGAGPVGCAIFEFSRVVGRKLTLASQPRPASARRQDLVVMAGGAVLAVLVMTLPSLLQIGKGPVSGRVLGGECVAPVVLDCAARIESSVYRVAAVPPGGAVRLRSNIEGIQYHHPKLKQGVVMIESVEDALAQAGYRVAADGEVLVDVEATGGATPVLVVHIADKSGEVARFTTTFAKGARLEDANPRTARVVVDIDQVRLPMFAKSGPDGNVRLADGLYAQLRRALGSEREAAVFAAASTRTATAGSGTSLPEGYTYVDKVLATNCAGVAELRTQTAPERSMPGMISSLHEISFGATGQTALLNHNEFVSCHDSAVWFVRLDRLAHLLHVRRYDTQGSLQRAWRVTLPPVAVEVSRFPEPETLRELDGQVQLRMYVIEGLVVPKRLLMPFAFPV